MRQDVRLLRLDPRWCFHLIGQAAGDLEAGAAPGKLRARAKLGLLPLVALIFYEVSGGPFGTEVSGP